MAQTVFLTRLARDVLLAFAFGVIAAAAAVWADQLPAVSAGVRAGPLIGRTDLTDSVSGFGQVFVRARMRTYADIEANAGYSRLTGRGFATDIGQMELRLILQPAVSGQWQPLAYGGVGLMRQAIDDFSPRSTAKVEAVAWSASLPLGLGFRRLLSPRMALEVLGNFTYTLRDDLDSAPLRKGNDTLFSLGIGLVFGRFDAPPAPRFHSRAGDPARPRPLIGTRVAAEAVDRDSDGLTDDEETRQWFTNPLMADSDMDGLTDGEEVHTHGSDPNVADTDGDGAFDGAEVATGRNPLVADADASQPESAPQELPAPPPASVPFELTTISFPSGGAELTVEAQARLEEVARHLQQNPALEIEIRGFTDSLGERRDNLRLSGRRCGLIRDYLVELGIEDGRLTLVAFGEDDQAADNSTREGRRMNRRVELVPVAQSDR